MKTLCAFLFVFALAHSAFAGVSVIGGLTREESVQPGEKFEGTIKLQNTGETSCQVNVYQTDYLFFADGSNNYGEPGSTIRSNAKWISVSPRRLTIPPQEEALIHYSGQVPPIMQLASVYNDLGQAQSQASVGTYWSMIMIEPMPEASPEAVENEPGDVSFGIQTKVRYGIQIVSNIGDTGVPKIKFLDKRLLTEDETTILQLDIENVGERWLSPDVWVELYDKDGGKVGRFEGQKKRIYPGCSVRHKVELAGVAEGEYKVLVVVDNGDQYVFGARYDLGIE